MASTRVKDGSGLTSAETALQSRVIAGKAAVSYAKNELSTLNKTINELTHALSRQIAGESVSTEKHKPFIYGLLTGKPVSITQQFSDERESDCCKLLSISDPWQRSIHDQWIIGVDVSNCAEIYLSDLHLMVTVPFRSFQHRSKLFPLDEKFRVDFTSSAPPPKRLHLDGPVAAGVLEPGQSAVLTLAFGVAELGHHPELRLNIAVAFKRKRLANTLTDCCIACSPITVTAASVVNRRTLNLELRANGTDAVHDLAALNAYNNAVVQVALVSKSGKVGNILEQLQDVAGMSYHPYLEILYWTQLQSLQNVWIVVDHTADKFTIHARDRGQFFEVVQYLHGKLPADFSILPANRTSMPSLLSCLRDEVQLTSDFLENAAGVQSPAKGNVDLESYRTFRRTLFRLEQQTDSAAGSGGIVK